MALGPQPLPLPEPLDHMKETAVPAYLLPLHHRPTLHDFPSSQASVP